MLTRTLRHHQAERCVVFLKPTGQQLTKTYMPPSSQQVSVIQMYAPRTQIYVREAKGMYANWRWICLWLTQFVFYGLPWLNWNGRQAVLFDLGARKFYLFGLVLWPQDLIYLALLLIIAAFSLFLFTAVAGRVWCGFACPQTVYTELFMWIERKIEGERSARMRLDRQPWSIGKLSRKATKHAAWILLSLWTGFTFVGYFTPVNTLMTELAANALGPWQLFWVVFYSFATYGNAGWMREQVCRYMCPYARFQSSMFDQDTLIVSYDQHRGEPRAALSKSEQSQAGGACIDCSLCVQVCPTGIDIRDGLQYDCISCAACVDACDSVMDKIQAPRGLVRFTTSRAVRGATSIRNAGRLLRPRVMFYSGLLGVFIAAFALTLVNRLPIKMDIIRDRGVMAREVENGMIENAYRLQVMNTGENIHRYKISVSGIDGIVLTSSDTVVLSGTESRAVPATVRVPAGSGKRGSNRVVFKLVAIDDARLSVQEKAMFYVPG